MTTSRITGRHVTAMVTAVCLAIVLAPVTGLATTSSGSRVVLTDPTDAAHRAHVSAAGALAVAGAVTASPGLPGKPFTVTASSGFSPATFTVPTGRHLVIQTVSVDVDVTGGNTIFAEMTYTTAGNTDGHLFIPLTYSNHAASGYDTYLAALPVQLYADPGTAVELSVSSPSGGSTGTVFLSVSGYLV